MSLTSLQLAPPSTWQAFEALCWDLFTGEWGSREGARHGRNGQPQHGVDIVGRSARGWQAVQCKQIGPEATFTEAMLRASVTQALEFEPPLQVLTIATTAPRDRKLQRLARKISDTHRAQGLFEVHVAAWEDLCARLDLQPQIVLRHFPGLARFGASTLSTDFQVRIDNFCAQYTGGEKSVLFGGRDAEIADLNAWLESDAAPYRLMRAPAGRGKSALIVAWLSQLSAAVNVVFMPISVRFRTNLAQVVFPSLLRRLAVLHREAPPDVHELPLEVCRALVSDYLTRPVPHGQRVLVVIDGLDEAADFELAADFLPASAPPGLKVLLSGRPSGRPADPLAALTAGNVTPLAPLAAADVSHLALEAGIEPATAAEIVRLADGDPLLVRHYVEGLVTGELNPQMLASRPAGMRGFFEGWWRDQVTLWEGLTTPQRDVIDELICTLSCALAPMRLDDLSELLPSLRTRSALDLDAAFTRIARLLVGEPRTEGLAIAHPRFAEYIREEWMSQVRRAEFESRFIEWGLQTLHAAGLAPQSTPVCPYLIQNLGAHLERAGAGTDRLLKLTSHTWLEHWHQQDPSLDGFLIDVERCQRAAARELRSESPPAAAATRVGALVTCALATMTVVMARASIPPAVYVMALKLGYWTPEVVLAHIRTVEDVADRAEAIEAIAPLLSAKYGPALLALVQSIEPPATQSPAFAGIYRYLDPSGQLIARAAMSRYLQSDRYATLDLSALADETVALAMAREVSNPVIRAYALAELLPTVSASARAAIEKEVLLLVRRHAKRVAQDLRYHGALANLSLEGRHSVVGWILEAADPDEVDGLALIQEFAAAGDAAIAGPLIAAAQVLGDPWQRSDALQAIAPLLSPTDVPAYLAAAGDSDMGALAALGARYPGEWVQRVLTVCQRGYYHYSIRAPILINASRLLADDARRALMPEILADLGTAGDGRAWDQHDPEWLLVDFAETFLPRDSKTALALVRGIESEDVRAAGASQLYLKADASDRGAWLDLIRAVDDPMAVIDALCTLANHSEGEARRAFCEEARRRALETGQASWLIAKAVVSSWDLATELGVELLRSALEFPRFSAGEDIAWAVAAYCRGASAEGFRTALRVASTLEPHLLFVPLVPASPVGFSEADTDDFIRRVEPCAAATKVETRGAFTARLLVSQFKNMSEPQRVRTLQIAWQVAEKGDWEPLGTCAAELEGTDRARLLSEIDQRIAELPRESQATPRRIVDFRVRRSASTEHLSMHEPGLNAGAFSLEQLIKALHHSAEPTGDRREFAALVESLAQEPQRVAASGFDAALRVIGRWHRKHALSALSEFMPVVQAIAGASGVDAVLAALEEHVSTWC